MKRYALILLLIACDPAPVTTTAPRAARAPVTTTAPRMSQAQQQLHNCRSLCSSQGLDVTRAVTGEHPLCECGTSGGSGAMDGVGVGVGLEVGRHVTRHLIKEFW